MILTVLDDAGICCYETVTDSNVQQGLRCNAAYARNNALYFVRGASRSVVHLHAVTIHQNASRVPLVAAIAIIYLPSILLTPRCEVLRPVAARDQG